MISRNPKDRDHTIEDFIKSVQLNSDTIETCSAFGNLCRSKEDINRTIHIRQKTISRPDIDKQINIWTLAETSMKETREEA